MNDQAYWTRIVSTKALSRRRVMAATAGGLTGAALVAACGGSSSSSSSGSSAASAKPADSKAQAQLGTFTASDGTPQPGGRYVFTATSVANFNPVAEWSD